MTALKLNIEHIQQSEDIPFDLLALADPSPTQVTSYVRNGRCYVAKLEAKLIGVFVLAQLDTTTFEIKNIAITPSEQGKGYGKALLDHAEQVSKTLGGHQLKIGTGNSSIGQLALYQKQGFDMARIEKDFFITHYAEPIFENGIQCKHMVILVKDLGQT